MDTNIPFEPALSTLAPARPRSAAELPRLEAVWARHADDVREAQRLRHRVFAGEMGARLSPPAGTEPGLDVDLYDRFCEHLLVRSVETDDAPAQVVGTYRVLTPDAARLVGGLYTDNEFDLVRLARLRPRMAELGRSCTDAEWRTGAVILLLWSSLAEFMHRNGLDLMIGCASVPMRDGGHAAASLWHTLQQTHLAPIEEQVTPRLALPVDELRCDLAVEPPPLIKGYLKCGAKVLGAPAWDPDFGTADLPMMLRLSELPASYRRRFLRI
ncbi:MAG: GNAT family N-acetyltransferase [Ideonella sp.]|nr:GNAT family N-acetyltransferase [Ideonella sp.]MBL0149137.1 GNAT family N-acetyltransferase [Ideonella sp.]